MKTKSLAIVLAIAAVALAVQYRAHRNRKAGGAQPWTWQGYYLLFMLGALLYKLIIANINHWGTI